MRESAFGMRRAGEVAYLEVQPFAATGVARAVMSTRLGGVSRGGLASLNLGSTVGDHPDNVAENRRRYAAAAGFRPEDQVQARQVHGTRVAVVEEPCFPGECDALVTARPGVVLTVLAADCVPVYFLDPVRRVAGIAHAGWRGTAGAVGRAVLAAMQNVYGCRSADCFVAIGPSIGPCCYKVDRPVADRFFEAFPDHQRAMLREAGPGRWRLDLWAANRLPLLEAGVREERIYLSGYCTACRTDLFYSHRAGGGRTGRMAAAIWLVSN